MSQKQVELNRGHVRALRAVLKASNDLTEDVEDQLPSENEDATVELDDAHIDVVDHLLEAYQFVEWDELPEGEEYRADLDVVRDVKSSITEN
ncbi:hypothetical protein [Halarchaeum salinum]|uniref:Uncharacterized protein n=1 Tax=Halarchaeum salinum TaxID=489912 RepID=A0AAV3S354_9EURY